jgi:hypothetical protein
VSYALVGSGSRQFLDKLLTVYKNYNFIFLCHMNITKIAHVQCTQEIKKTTLDNTTSFYYIKQYFLYKILQVSTPKGRHQE